METQYDQGEARAVLRLLFERRYGLAWTDVLCDGIVLLPEEKQRQLSSDLQQLEQGIPVQYVMGEALFHGEWFHVTDSVLIPRPETEELVDAVLEDDASTSSMLDIGTGSGCIAISCAHECPNWHVCAFDISKEALQVAQENAARLNADNIIFHNIDILQHEPDCCEKWNIIVSNPPYICYKEKTEMEHHVTDYEPGLALFVPDDDPLLFYKAITTYAIRTLLTRGRLLFEVNRTYAHDVAKLLENRGFTDVFIRKDQFDNERIIGGRWQ